MHRAFTCPKIGFMTSLASSRPSSASSAFLRLTSGSPATVVLSGLCLFMIWWSLVLPGTFRAGSADTAHTALLAKAQVRLFAPENICLGFRDHLDIRLLHSFVAGVWSVCMLHQLNPWLSSYSPTAHRWCGYVFLTCSLSLAGSYGLMELRGLTHHSQKPAPMWRSTRPTFIVMAAWFMYTGIMALTCARNKRLAEHRVWALRHMGAGVWVVIHRMLIFVCMTIDRAATKVSGGWPDLLSAPAATRVIVFEVLSVAAMAIAVAITEAEAQRRAVRATLEKTA